MLSEEKMQKVLDLVAKEDNKMTANVNRCFVAK